MNRFNRWLNCKVVLELREKQNKKLRDENRRLREALEFYADDGNWTHQDYPSKHASYNVILGDGSKTDNQVGGETARKALAETEEQDQ